MRLLYLCSVWPETTSSAAGVRVLQLLQSFNRSGVFSKIACASPGRSKSVFRDGLEAHGFDTRNCGFPSPCAPNDARFDRALLEFKPDVVVFERFVLEEFFGWRVQKVVPEAMRVVDTQDLHFLRKRRHRMVDEQMREGKKIDISSILNVADCLESNDEELVREMASLHRSDAVLVVSNFEQELLQNCFGMNPNKVYIAPFLYEIPETNSFKSLDERRRAACTIGNFRHAPNVDAVEWLKTSIWPQVNRLSNRKERVDVYGAYPRKEHMLLTDENEGFHVRGPTKHQYNTLAKYRVLVAPLRFGAGIKGKIADAWAVGTPVVTTGIGAEGMGSAEEWEGLVANDEVRLAEKVVRLLKDDSYWYQAQQQGSRLLGSLFDREDQGPRLVEFIVEAQRTLKQRRSRDFMGGLLWSEQTRSQEFKSRYLMAKNELEAAALSQIST